MTETSTANSEKRAEQPRVKGIVGPMRSWQEYRDAICAMARHLTGEEYTGMSDAEWQEDYERLLRQIAARRRDVDPT